MRTSKFRESSEPRRRSAITLKVVPVYDRRRLSRSSFPQSRVRKNPYFRRRASTATCASIRINRKRNSVGVLKGGRSRKKTKCSVKKRRIKTSHGYRRVSHNRKVSSHHKRRASSSIGFRDFQIKDVLSNPITTIKSEIMSKADNEPIDLGDKFKFKNTDETAERRKSMKELTKVFNQIKKRKSMYSLIRQPSCSLTKPEKKEILMKYRVEPKINPRMKKRLRGNIVGMPDLHEWEIILKHKLRKLQKMNEELNCRELMNVEFLKLMDIGFEKIVCVFNSNNHFLGKNSIESILKCLSDFLRGHIPLYTNMQVMKMNVKLKQDLDKLKKEYGKMEREYGKCVAENKKLVIRLQEEIEKINVIKSNWKFRQLNQHGGYKGMIERIWRIETEVGIHEDCEELLEEVKKVKKEKERIKQMIVEKKVMNKSVDPRAIERRKRIQDLLELENELYSLDVKRKSLVKEIESFKRQHDMSINETNERVEVVRKVPKIQVILPLENEEDDEKEKKKLALKKKQRNLPIQELKKMADKKGLRLHELLVDVLDISQTKK